MEFFAGIGLGLVIGIVGTSIVLDIHYNCHYYKLLNENRKLKIEIDRTPWMFSDEKESW